LAGERQRDCSNRPYGLTASSPTISDAQAKLGRLQQQRRYLRDGDQRMLDKFRIPEMVLGALFASSLWAGIWGWTDSYAPTEKQKQECYDTAQKTGQKSDECKTFWERTTSDPVAFFTLVLAVSTVGLWVATGALYIAGERQIEIAKQSANAARDAAEHIPRVERAYLFLWHELKHKITPNPCGGEILEVQFALRNQGSGDESALHPESNLSS
jgi:hypothetical protein